MAQMHNPPHPGLTLRDDVLPALGLSVTEAAQQLDVSRVTRHAFPRIQWPRRYFARNGLAYRSVVRCGSRRRSPFVASGANCI